MHWLGMFLPRPKVYIHLGHALLPVIGPQAFLDSIGGYFGRVIIYPNDHIERRGTINAEIHIVGGEVNGFRFSSLILEEPANLQSAGNQEAL